MGKTKPQPQGSSQEEKHSPPKAQKTDVQTEGNSIINIIDSRLNENDYKKLNYIKTNYKEKHTLIQFTTENTIQIIQITNTFKNYTINNYYTTIQTMNTLKNYTINNYNITIQNTIKINTIFKLFSTLDLNDTIINMDASGTSGTSGHSETSFVTPDRDGMGERQKTPANATPVTDADTPKASTTGAQAGPLPQQLSLIHI